MSRHYHSDKLIYVLLLMVTVFVAGRLGGTVLSDNNWSFGHWQHLPTAYIVGWLGLLVAIGWLSAMRGNRIVSRLSTRAGTITGLAAVFGLLVLFQFDSFLYGGGNLRIAQVAQTDTVIYRWFEFGSLLIVSRLDDFFNLFGMHYNRAGLLAWKVFSFGAVLLTLAAAVKLVAELTEDAVRRVYLFLILLSVPATVLMFGFVGTEPIVLAVSLWFAVAAVRLQKRFTPGGLVFLWMVVATGLFMQYLSVYLLPAAVYITVRGRQRNRRLSLPALVAGLLTLVALVALAYYRGGYDLEYARQILFPAGKPPHSDYGVFSPRHLSDLAQLIFLAFPQILVVIYLMVGGHWSRRINRGTVSWLLLLSLSGLTTVTLIDPVNSIVLDFPRLTVYLLPLSLLLIVLVRDRRTADNNRGPALLAAVCLMLPLSYLPTYLCIARADPYVTDYLDKHESFNRAGCLAFRDAYFYRKDLDEANAWERQLPHRSHDHLNLEGCRFLAEQGDEAEALRTLYGVIAQNPYWAEPRALFVQIQMQLNRYDLAKPQIDTCLMLEPYRKEFLTNRYRFYRDTRDYTHAYEAIREALEIYPHDSDFETDLMIVNYRSGRLPAADSIAGALVAADSTLAYPYLILGLLAEVRRDTSTAISMLNQFISLAPNEPETPAIMERINELKWNSEEQ